MKGDKIILKDLSQRLARTVYKWNREEDGRYGITQMLYLNDEGKDFNVQLPADKIFVFTFRREGANMEGVSVLRSAYKHWYIKDTLYKLDAVKHERQAVGIPVITLPAVHEESDEQEAEDILSNLRATEKSFVVLPSPDWKFEFAQMGASSVLDTEKSIIHHNTQIVQNILAGFLDLGKTGGGGSYALSEDQSSLFLLSLTALANQICDVFNRHVIPELVDLNFDVAEGQRYPKLTFQKLGEVKYEELASSLSTLTGSGLITPDFETEDHIRKLFDLPKKTEEEYEEDMDEMDEAGSLEEEAMDEDISEGEPTDEEAASKIRVDVKTEKEGVKSKKEELKKSVAEMSEDIHANGFSDADELSDFLEARKFFDPSILVRVQNYVQP